MTTENINQTEVSAAYIVNPTRGEVKIIVTKTKENKAENAGKAVAAFAKNTRYSINNNGGGYTGL